MKEEVAGGEEEVKVNKESGETKRRKMWELKAFDNRLIEMYYRSVGKERRD